MGFNYSREKLLFDREWEKLREKYKKAEIGRAHV